MRAVPVPDGLRTNLAARLAAARTSWWRHLLLRASAACVAGLLAASLTYSATRPSLDLTAAAEDANWQSGLWKPIDRAMDAVVESGRAKSAVKKGGQP